MIAESITTEIFLEGLISGIKPILPVFIPIIFAGAVWEMSKYFVMKVTYNLSRMSGNRKKQAKKHAKRVASLIDLASAINDVSDK